MQLKNAIEKMDDNTVMYIGSKVGYVFIGTKEEWYRDKDAIEKWCKQATLNEVAMAREAWERNIYTGLPKREDYGDPDRWAGDAFAAVTKLSISQKRLIEAKRANKNYKELERRLVVDEYEKQDPDEPGHVFIVGGTEAGKYWIRSEYISKRMGEAS